MAKDDWAVVVGIKRYYDPALAGLEGPENDARDFFNWVIAPTGGAVPPAQAKLVLSSDFPAGPSAADSMPTAQAIVGALEHLRQIAAENETKGLGRLVGRRLYLFFSGHGFAPARSDQLTALLTADASIPAAQLHHVIGSYVADYFWRARFFEEILLFMDCCRSIMDCTDLSQPFEDERASDFHQVRRFYAYGARVAKESREWQMADGQYHGVFTKTLLDALSGSAADPRTPSKITAESLRDQLYNGFKSFMSPKDQERPDLPKEPEVVYEQKPGGNFTIVTRGSALGSFLGLVKLSKYPVTLRIRPSLRGQRATLLDKGLEVVGTYTLADPLGLTLSKGLYALDFAGAGEPIPFEVTGAEREIHV